VGKKLVIVQLLTVTVKDVYTEGTA